MFGGKEIADLSKLIGIIKRQHKTSLFTKKTFFLFFQVSSRRIFSNKVQQKHAGQKYVGRYGQGRSLVPKIQALKRSCKNLKRFIFVTSRDSRAWPGHVLFPNIFFCNQKRSFTNIAIQVKVDQASSFQRLEYNFLGFFLNGS